MLTGCARAPRAARLACAAAAYLALASCSRPVPSPPNILLIVVDTLRADRLGSYGNDRGLTPFLDELAERGILFRNAYAPCSWTCPSVASLMTSRYPSQHRVSDFESVLGADELSFAEVLGTANYVTGGFSANFRLSRAQGYAQGFRTWHTDETTEKLRAPELRRFVQRWLRNNPQTPTLLYLQYMEPHAPYAPPEPYRTRFRRAGGAVEDETATRKLVQREWDDLSSDEVTLLASLYDGEVASLDAELRLLFGDLEQQGFLANAVVVVTADHGEEFREHGLLIHGLQLYDESVRVPLIVLAPGYRGGRVVDEPVSLIDIAPTLVELAGLPRQPSFEGRSLVPLLQRPTLWAWLAAFRATPPETRDVILELPRSGNVYDLRRQTDGLIRGRTKLLIDSAGKASVYDLRTDPGEMTPNPPRLDAAVAPLVETLHRATADQAKRAVASAAPRPLDDSAKEHLRALGYQH